MYFVSIGYMQIIHHGEIGISLTTISNGLIKESNNINVTNNFKNVKYSSFSHSIHDMDHRQWKMNKDHTS
jgi:hypothetical protein